VPAKAVWLQDSSMRWPWIGASADGSLGNFPGRNLLVYLIKSRYGVRCEERLQSIVLFQ